MPADQNDPIQFGQRLRPFRRQQLAARRQQNAVDAILALHRFHAVENRLRHHDQSRSPAKRIVVGFFMLVVGIRADVVRADIEDAVLLRAAEDARVQDVCEHFGKQR